MPKAVAVVTGIESLIHAIRGHRVLLDEDLARLYGVLTGALNRAVKRNQERFPVDFMFQLTAEEADNLKCQTGTSSGHGGRRRSLPYAFTEHGVVMLSSVLNSPRAVAVNIEVVRVFVRLRHAVMISAELAKRLAVVEAKLDQHRAELGQGFAETAKVLAAHEKDIEAVFEAIRQLIGETEDPTSSPRVGFELP